MFNKEEYIKDAKALLKAGKVFVTLGEAFEEKYKQYEDEIDEMSELDGEMAMILSEFEEFGNSI